MKEKHLEYSTNSVTVQLPHTRYVDKVLRSTSYEELMWRFMGCESPSKEISESYAAFSNLKKECLVHEYNWLHIGDGAHTRTAAIFAFFSKSINCSIDPQVNEEKFSKWRDRYNIKGVVPFKMGFEDFRVDYLKYHNNKPYSISCVHAHVKLEEVDKKFPGWVYLYTNPCCKYQEQTFSKQYMKENNIIEIINKEDLGILSEQRTVIIYKKITK